jgi:ABC-type branched-subunit amino acid transport system ATPase component
MIWRPSGLLDDWELDEWLHAKFRRSRESPPASPQVVEPDDSASLVASGVDVAFGGFQALTGVGIEAARSEVVGIIGPNGAGKTTLLNVITGLVESDSGRISLGDTDLTTAPSFKIARSGLVRTFQNLRLFPSLTVRENVEVSYLVAASHRRHRSPCDVDGLIAAAGLWAHRDRRARELDYGTSRRLELARAAATAPAFLLLDEPTSGMSDSESLQMIEQVRQMAGLVGAGVVVIDHDLNFIIGICDRIYCLDCGQVIAHGTPEEIQADPVVQAAYIGSTAEG